MSSRAAESVYDAGAAIDELLEKDDGELLAALAYHKASMAVAFGKAGMVEMLRAAVDAAPTVTYFSRRSRGEIDTGRPQVNLRVDDEKAFEKYAQLADSLRRRGIKGWDLGYGAKPGPQGVVPQIDELAMKLILDFKSAVVFEEVCKPLAETMNVALLKHWPKAQGRLVSLGAKLELTKMLVSNIFAINVTRITVQHSKDKMVQLALLI